MQIRWRNICLLSLVTVAVISAALAMSVIHSSQQKKQVDIGVPDTERTPYVEIVPVGFADPGPGIYNGREDLKRNLPQVFLPPKEAMLRQAALQAAKDADAAAKH